MKILWFTWKDLKHPLAGGAEVVNEEIAKRLVKDDHEVIFVVSGFKGCKQKDNVNGYKVIRLGNRYTVYFHAIIYYFKHLKGWAEIVIDEVNTAPFFCKFYVKERNILYINQLCRQIWFYQFPFPLSIPFYLFEPVYLWLLRDRKTIAISRSTKEDLLQFGFHERNIGLISMGIEIEPVPDLETIKKFSNFTLLSLGAIREMKRTDHQIKAFELTKKQIPELKLKIAGSGSGKYFEKVMKMIEDNPYKNDIEYLGRVSHEQKMGLMQKCHLILVTSVKEGWGLIVTEANSQGTPAIVYDVDGLRDSVQNSKTGLIAKQKTPGNLAAQIIELYNNQDLYRKLQKNAWKWSFDINFENTYTDFVKLIGIQHEKQAAGIGNHSN